MKPESRDRRYEKLVLLALSLLVVTLLGVLMHAGIQPQLVA